ncbi:MAG: P-loop NTPase [Rhodospirillales bacterium]|nr:P-loop NTPase [Rhodospirillales bacterium]
MISAAPLPEQRDARRVVPNMIAVASGKGGVGKTCLAITLAHALARRGARILLFDGDLGLANVDIQLGLMPRQDLGAVVAGQLPLAAAALAVEAGFDVIAGRSGCGRLAAAPPARIDALANELAETAAGYDHVLVDLGAGLEPTVRRLAAQAGRCFVVTTDEPTALTDAYAFLKVARYDRTASEMAVLVNMATSHCAGEKTYGALLRACEAFLQLSPRLLGVVRRDPRVREAIRCQAALLTRFPTCDAAVDVEAIAASLPAARR